MKFLFIRTPGNVAALLKLQMQTQVVVSNASKGLAVTGKIKGVGTGVKGKRQEERQGRERRRQREGKGKAEPVTITH